MRHTTHPNPLDIPGIADIPQRITAHKHQIGSQARPDTAPIGQAIVLRRQHRAGPQRIQGTQPGLDEKLELEMKAVAKRHDERNAGLGGRVGTGEDGYSGLVQLPDALLRGGVVQTSTRITIGDGLHGDQGGAIGLPTQAVARRERGIDRFVERGMVQLAHAGGQRLTHALVRRRVADSLLAEDLGRVDQSVEDRLNNIRDIRTNGKNFDPIRGGRLGLHEGGRLLRLGDEAAGLDDNGRHDAGIVGRHRLHGRETQIRHARVIRQRGAHRRATPGLQERRRDAVAALLVQIIDAARVAVRVDETRQEHVALAVDEFRADQVRERADFVPVDDYQAGRQDALPVEDPHVVDGRFLPRLCGAALGVVGGEGGCVADVDGVVEAGVGQAEEAGGEEYEAEEVTVEARHIARDE